MPQKPDPFPVRKVAEGQWQVLIVNDNLWHSCKSESDARLISRAPVCEHEHVNRIRTDHDFADELEQLADAFERNEMRFGAGFFRDSAEQLRR